MEVIGERVDIKLTEKKDLNNILNLWNNGDVMKWVGFPEGLNLAFEKIQEWFSSVRKSELTNHYVVSNKNNLFCGELFYMKNLEHKRAGLDIKFLPETQSKGLATEALKLFIDFIFKTEELIDAVWTEPSKENIAARGLYDRCGLSEKERPDDMESADSYWELTREEWKRNI
jgi:RimJ/RimL family protein N-acetyltransferase